MSGFRSLIGAIGSAGSDMMANGIKKDDEIEREARLMEKEQAMARFTFDITEDGSVDVEARAAGMIRRELGPEQPSI